MGTSSKRSVRALLTLALLALPTVAFADVTPAPVVAPTPQAPPTQTPTQSQTPSQSQTPTQSQTPSKSQTQTAAQIAAQKKADAAAAKLKAAQAKQAQLAAAKAKAEQARQARLAAARKQAALVAAQKKAAAEHARVVAQQQHAEDTAQATFAHALQRDEAYRFAASAAESIGATAAMQSAPIGASDTSAGSKAFATTPSNAPVIPMFAAIIAAIALATAAAYAIRLRAWRVVR